MKTDPNAPINPSKHLNTNGQIDTQYTGLTKREYFAAMAMQGMVTALARFNFTWEEIMERSVKIADALINELNKSDQ